MHLVTWRSAFTKTYKTNDTITQRLVVDSNLDSHHRLRRLHNNDTTRHDKWIVVTTIQAPTAAVRLMNNIAGWQLVVVGDKKTPIDWRLKGAIYLSPDDQEALNYHVTSHIPYYSYSRKIIGYLYAIEHGAEYIYETDDDNFMSSLDAFHKNFTNKALIVKTNAYAFNPYQYFGQISMWPRGYPLEFIGADPVRDYVHCSVETPAVQQGLVNGDPDVDAIYRMTRKHHGVDLNVTFDTEAPLVILPNGVFCPYNSQNTFFTKDAFWSLILFRTITARETDIYRSYWAQRLLWLTGSYLSFFAPKTVQERNAHSYNQDARDEIRLYTEIERLVEFLSKWKCNVKSFKHCVELLTLDLSNDGFIGIEDVALVKAWTADLTDLGYTWPIRKRESSICRPENDKLNVKFYPNEQKASRSFSGDLSNLEQLNNKALATQTFQSVCNTSSIDFNFNKVLIPQQSNVLLIISITDDSADIGLIDAYYRRFFSQVIYCLPSGITIDIVERQRVSYFIRKSGHSTECINVASTMHYSVEKYLLITQNLMLAPNLWKSGIKMPNTVWIGGDDRNQTSHRNRTIKRKGCLSNDKICIYTSKVLVETFATNVKSLEQQHSIDSTMLKCIANSMAMNNSAVSRTNIVAMYIDQHHCDMINNLHRTILKNNFLVDHANFILEAFMYNCIGLVRSQLKGIGAVILSDFVKMIPNFNFKNVKSSQSEHKTYCKVSGV